MSYYSENKEIRLQYGHDYYRKNRERILEEARNKRREAGVKERGPYGKGPKIINPAPKAKNPPRPRDMFYYIEAKQWAVNELGGKCQECGYNKCLAALEFDHVNPSDKSFSISEAIQRKKFDKELIREELRKCQLLCANCHREKTVIKGDYRRGRRLDQAKGPVA